VAVNARYVADVSAKHAALREAFLAAGWDCKYKTARVTAATCQRDVCVPTVSY
jgi:hypothetical protein